MMKKNEKWIYAPVSDEAALQVAEIATSACGAELCANISRCHRECMILIGEFPMTLEDGLIPSIRLKVSIWCDKGQKYSITDNYGPDAIEPTDVRIPTHLIKPAMTTKERARLQRQVRERYEAGADEEVEMEVVRWY